MIVPTEKLKEWEGCLDHGDIAKIASKCGKHPLTISRAINKGLCTRDTYMAIEEYLQAENPDNQLKRIHETDSN